MIPNYSAAAPGVVTRLVTTAFQGWRLQSRTDSRELAKHEKAAEPFWKTKTLCDLCALGALR